MVVGETLDAKVAAEEGLGEVDGFDFDLDFVDLAVGGLGAFEFAAGTEEGGIGVGLELLAHSIMLGLMRMLSRP